MQLIVVPHSAGQRRATLWLCATGAATPPGDVAIEVEKTSSVPVPGSGWRAVTAGGALPVAERRTFVQVVEVGGLQPGTRYQVRFGQARARISTLPARLPRDGEPPFRLLLTSCFYIGRNNGAALAQALAAMPADERPDLKFLCGDQVYLDFPAFVLGVPFTETGLARSFLGKYLRNWGDEGGFQTLLREGASYFTADDHEFWNNFPNAATVISNTWTRGGRNRLRGVAGPLFADFQCERPEEAGKTREFQAGRLSFMVADTSIDRREGEDVFMDGGELARVAAWARGLNGPGVLVVGQPIFERPSNWFTKRFVDRTLPNYRQYADLVRALFDLRHSILVFTGDVHFGRVAAALLPRSGDMPEITEVIASPSALVFPPQPQVDDAPPRFPAEALPQLPQAPVRTRQEDKRAGDNFVTLAVTEAGGLVRVKLRHWWLRESGGPQPGIETTVTLS